MIDDSQNFYKVTVSELQYVKQSKKTIVPFTKEQCFDEANKYKTRKQFRENSQAAYYFAKRQDWLDEVCCEMHEVRRPGHYWTKERCAEEALKYNMKINLKKSCISAYSSAVRKGWLSEICSHMLDMDRLPRGYWTKDRCREEASKHPSRDVFRDKCRGAFNACERKGC